MNDIFLIKVNLSFSVPGAIPVKEIVTMVLPTNTGQSSTSPAPVAILTYTERKVPISIKHMGKSKDFTFLETKSIGDLRAEIRRLSAPCTAAFEIAGIPADVALTNALKIFSIKLPDLSPLKVILQCADKNCHERFNSGMIVKPAPTHEQLLEAKNRKIAELMRKNELLENQIKKSSN